jgi:hypothetical protein
MMFLIAFNQAAISSGVVKTIKTLLTIRPFPAIPAIPMVDILNFERKLRDGLTALGFTTGFIGCSTNSDIMSIPFGPISFEF